MERQVDKQLKIEIEKFKKKLFEVEYVNSEVWHEFYQFILLSYECERKNRYSVSDISEILRPHEQRGYIATIYAHGLYMVAMSNNIRIYKNGFNP
ncbi:hypothetical protein [Planococcus lenghuensis]|uniref:Uncharacterized protein n=1 Tax=Planococcus lenghuensis TaxID=2213202 RepID=A0A1Q2L4M6_9BACL|nr:hypothetical protein [Planococcus lenghuensis]AQQ55408.1 hypothetical protein B0X71_19770 [Planococcus lenghuensis]